MYDSYNKNAQYHALMQLVLLLKKFPCDIVLEQNVAD